MTWVFPKYPVSIRQLPFLPHRFSVLGKRKERKSCGGLFFFFFWVSCQYKTCQWENIFPVFFFLLPYSLSCYTALNRNSNCIFHKPVHIIFSICISSYSIFIVYEISYFLFSAKWTYFLIFIFHDAAP